MSKPIVVIYWPESYQFNGLDRLWIYEFMAFLNGEDTRGNFYTKHDFSDHHWFCFYKDDITDPEFKVFYEKDFTPIQYEELKKMVMDSLPKQTQDG